MRNFSNNGPSLAEQRSLIKGDLSPELYTERHLGQRLDCTPLKNVKPKYRLDTKSNRGKTSRHALEAQAVVTGLISRANKERVDRDRSRGNRRNLLD